MKLFAVTGKPILHSKSPLMFNAVFEQEGMEARYFRLAADTAAEAIELMRENKVEGLNVTAPFKQDMLPLMDVVDGAAQKIGSINTVVLRNGKLTGYNTDHLGVANSLRAHHVDLKGKKCLVLGAGGAARGVVYALLAEKAEVTVLNRTVAKAEELAEEFGCEALPIQNLKEALRTADVFVSTLGGDICLVEASWLQASTVVFDANYKSSTLLKLAKEQNCKTISGLDWLLHQATPAYEYFLGEKPNIETMRAGLEKPPVNKKNYNMSLIGFMGVGKTTNGSLFAEQHDMRFVDNDIAITKRYKKSIPDIFEQEGEVAFREKEAETLEHVMRYPNTIISCGGGLVVTPKNRELLMRRTLVVWLVASAQQVIDRVKPNSRPLLAVEDPLAKAKELFEKRVGFYAEAADIMINTEGKTTAQIVDKIYEEINLAFNS